MNIQSIVLINGTEEPTTLVLEPWGEEYVMSPKERCEIIFSGPPGSVEVEHSRSRIIVYGWPESIAKILVDGKEI